MTTCRSFEPPNPAAIQQQLFRALNRVLEPAVRSGIGNPLAGPGALVLETTGRRTRLARRVPLLGARLGDTLWVSTVRPSSQWVRNLEHQPDASVWVGGRQRPVRADVARLGPATVARLQIDD